MSLTHRIITAAALAIVILPSAGMAQSVLERVLGQIDGVSNFAKVNGTFANIAENAGGFRVESVLGSSTVYMLEDAEVSETDYLAARDAMVLAEMGEIIYTPGTDSYVYDSTNFVTEAEALAARQADVDAFVEVQSATVVFTPAVTTYAYLGEPYYTAEEWAVVYEGVPTSDADRINISTAGYPYGGTTYGTEAEALAAVDVAAEAAYSGILSPTAESWSYDGVSGSEAASAAAAEAAALTLFDSIASVTEGSGVVDTLVPIGIDGSITNIITGVTSATQEAVAGAATATEVNLPTLDLGDMATTALGAVNTGEITLGVNSAVDEAKTSTTNAISAVMTQIGGSADTGALVLNVASNASAVNGSIENTMAQVNGSIGNLSTTALGAVNTGTIISGVNAAVQGIVGMSGQSATGL